MRMHYAKLCKYIFSSFTYTIMLFGLWWVFEIYSLSILGLLNIFITALFDRLQHLNFKLPLTLQDKISTLNRKPWNKERVLFKLGTFTHLWNSNISFPRIAFNVFHIKCRFSTTLHFFNYLIWEYFYLSTVRLNVATKFTKFRANHGFHLMGWRLSLFNIVCFFWIV